MLRSTCRFLLYTHLTDRQNLTQSKGMMPFQWAMGHVWLWKLKTLLFPTTILNHISYLTIYMIRFMLNGIYICQDVTDFHPTGRVCRIFWDSCQTWWAPGYFLFWVFLVFIGKIEQTMQTFSFYSNFNLYLTETVMLGELHDASDMFCLQQSN